MNTGNVEIAALFAPKPLGMTAADDWTKEMPTKGYPELQQHYRMMGAPENVQLTALLQFPHNYNYVSRAAMYYWMNRHLKLGAAAPIVEGDFKRLTIPEMTVWDDAHPKPESGPEFERKLLRTMSEAAQAQLDEGSQAQPGLSKIQREATSTMIGRTLDEAGDVQWKMTTKEDRGACLEMVGMLQNSTYEEELPVVFLYPKKPLGSTVIWLTRNGKAGLYNADGTVRAEVARLLEAGVTVTGIDLLYQGEFTADGKSATRTRTVKNPREAAPYTLGYNDSLLAQRVHDVLTTVAYMWKHEQRPKEIDLIALDPEVAPIAGAACAVSNGSIKSAAVNTGGFRFGKLLDLRDVNFLPGGAKYGDLPAMLSACDSLWVAGEESGANAKANGRNYLKTAMIDQGSPEGTESRAISWLLKKR